MVMSFFWTGMVLISVLFSFWSGTGSEVTQAALKGAQEGVTLTISMAGAICLWSGVATVMERGGMNRVLNRILMPLIGRIFPSARRDAEAGDLIAANMTANLLGLGNAATPMGIAATRRLSRYAKSNTASHEMCRLIVMNTASIQLLPTNVAAVRSALGASAPFDILPAVWVTSLCSVSAGLAAAFIMERGCKDD